ncbi:MAG: Flp family type IVb pilin [Janthinobacterium lividum]
MRVSGFILAQLAPGTAAAPFDRNEHFIKDIGRLTAISPTGSLSFEPGIIPPPINGKNMSKFLKAFVRDERGVSAMEYAVLAGVIVVALVASGTSFSSGVKAMFTTMFSNVWTAQSKASSS